MRRHFLTTTAVTLLALTGPANADMEAAKKFLDTEIGDVSSLDRAAQEAEMQWFVDAAKPFAGMDIKVVSETITTHEYESKVLAPAFRATSVRSSPRKRPSRSGTPMPSRRAASRRS